MDGEDTFESRIPPEFLDVLLRLGHEFGFDPTSSDELEDYFTKLLTGFTGTPDHPGDWLRPRLARSFRCATSAPIRIQGGNRQLCQGRPMLFMGEIDVPAMDGVLHDAASFYVFFDPETGERRTVMQIS